jgi:hypothetical protein
MFISVASQRNLLTGFLLYRPGARLHEGRPRFTGSSSPSRA